MYPDSDGFVGDFANGVRDGAEDEAGQSESGPVSKFKSDLTTVGIREVVKSYVSNGLTCRFTTQRMDELIEFTPS